MNRIFQVIQSRTKYTPVVVSENVHRRKRMSSSKLAKVLPLAGMLFFSTLNGISTRAENLQSVINNGIVLGYDTNASYYDGGSGDSATGPSVSNYISTYCYLGYDTSDKTYKVVSASASSKKLNCHSTSDSRKILFTSIPSASCPINIDNYSSSDEYLTALQKHLQEKSGTKKYDYSFPDIEEDRKSVV